MSITKVLNRLQGPYNIKGFNLVGKTKQEDLYTFINTYKDLIKNNKHDLGFVNLYDIKKSFRKGYETFIDIIQSVYYSRQALGIGHINFSNISIGIDRRKRFPIYVFLSQYTWALKIKIEL